jgi:hypothetical protein
MTAFVSHLNLLLESFSPMNQVVERKLCDILICGYL